jgi:hypothetical protein
MAKELDQKMNSLKSEAEAGPVWGYLRMLVQYSATTRSLLGGGGRNRTDA